MVMTCRPAQLETPGLGYGLCLDGDRGFCLPRQQDLRRLLRECVRSHANGSQAGDAHVLNDRAHTKMAAAELWARWLALLPNPAWEDLRSAWTELDEVFQAGDSSLAALWGCAFGRCMRHCEATTRALTTPPWRRRWLRSENCSGGGWTCLPSRLWNCHGR